MTCLLLSMVCAFVASHGGVEATTGVFLARTPAMGLDGLTISQAATLGDEIESLFGRGSIQGRLPRLENALVPVFNSLVAEGHHALDSSAARYALDRYFVARHGWRVMGLDPEGAAWNTSSPTVILDGRVPPYIKQMFDSRLEESGLDVHSLAILAATFEMLVRGETIKHLAVAYQAMYFHTSDVLNDNEVDLVVEMNKLVDMFGRWASMDVGKLVRLHGSANLVYPGWEDTQLFLRDSRLSLAHTETEIRNPFHSGRSTFDDVLHIVEASNDEFGHFQDKECQHLKQILLAHEHKGTGRVPTSKYFGLGRAGHPQFTEPLSYLRHVGLVDDADPNNPMVIIPNWLYAKTNCLGSTELYSICCVNECHAIMAHLEKHFSAPRIEPDRLADAVAHISSATVVAPRNLSSTMLRRLNEIAESNGGAVPLHGRLFAQWLHHAFPRECPFPHVAHAYRQLTIDEWKKVTGAERGYLNSQELAVHGEKMNITAEDDLDAMCWMMDEKSEQLTAWSREEELFPSGLPSSSDFSFSRTSLQSTLRMIAMLGAVIGLLVAMKQTARGGLSFFCSDKSVREQGYSV